MLDLDEARGAATPKDAATLVLARDGAEGVELFCVERSKKLRFMGGAVVFPGGKLDDAHDRDAAWEALSTAPDPRGLGFAADAETLRALAVAACRESLEEAAILPVAGGSLRADDLAAMRAAPMRPELVRRGLRLDLAALHPLARWITPAAESRRYDARFFVVAAPAGQPGAHDESETLASFWATPASVLRRFDAGEVQLAPPTNRTLEILSSARTVGDALAIAAAACLDPVCPKLVRHEDTLALVLPGDPEHDVRTARVPGRSRFVLRGERWRPE